jgi:cell filamentation protein
MEKYNYTYEGSENYCFYGTDVLKNKLGIRDDNDLIIAEKEITSLKILMLYNMPIAKEFDLNSLCKIHKIIFDDIYEWAGQIRKGEFLLKGSSIFCRGQYIIESANKIFNNILEENNLYGLRKSDFVKRMAHYMGEVNALHPFREGNGRASREFFRQLSLNAGYTLDFSEIKNPRCKQRGIFCSIGNLLYMWGLLP